MKMLFTFLLLVSFSAFGAIEDFEGRYEVVSGEDNTIGCIDFKITYNSQTSTVDVVMDRDSYFVWEIVSINKGRVPFENDWTDGVTRGYQNNKFDSKKNQITHEVRTVYGFHLYRKVILTLVNDVLTIERKTEKKVCILKKI